MKVETINPHTKEVISEFEVPSLLEYYTVIYATILSANKYNPSETGFSDEMEPLRSIVDPDNKGHFDKWISEMTKIKCEYEKNNVECFYLQDHIDTLFLVDYGDAYFPIIKIPDLSEVQ